MTPEQAILNLYRASRLAPLPAHEHEALRQQAELVMRALKPEPAGASEEPATAEPVEE